MARNIVITVEPSNTDGVVEMLTEADGVLGVKLFKGASVKPAGDVVTVEATNDAAVNLVRQLLSDTPGAISMQTQAPKGVISAGASRLLDRETNDAVWEEVALYIRAESNPSTNFLALMALSGAVASVGLWTDTLHLVIGAMVLAPGFHPLLRIPLGYIAGPKASTGPGYVSSATGYVAMAFAAAVAVVLLRLLTPADIDEVTSQQWIRYWSHVTASGVLVSVLAAAAGAMVVMADRGVLAAGAMIALALVPGMTLVGFGFAVGDAELAGRGALRWAVDAGLVIGVGGALVGLKRAVVHHRRADSS